MCVDGKLIYQPLQSNHIVFDTLSAEVGTGIKQTNMKQAES